MSLFVNLGAGGHGGSGKTADLQGRYNEIASIVSRHTTSSSPSTFRRLVHSSSLDKRNTVRANSANAAGLTVARHVKATRNHHRQTNESENSNESSNDSMSEDDFYYDYNEPNENDFHRSRPIEPILTAANVGPPVGTSLNQQFQIRSSVHLEHRLGPMTIHHQQPNINNRIASCAVCNIL